MANQMLSRRGKLLSRLPGAPSLAGRGLVERMRSTAFALLGVTAAMALGLVALASRQTWPDFPVGPIPTYEAKAGKVDSAVALAPSLAQRDPARATLTAGRSTAPGTGVGGSKGSGLSSSRQASSAPTPPDPTGGYPGGESTTAPAPSPPSQDPGPSPPRESAPPPAPVPASPPPPTPVATSQPGVLPPVTSSSPGKGHAYGKQKISLPKPKPSHPAPSPVLPPVAPPATEPAPPAALPDLLTPGEDSSDGHGDGYGHGHGHGYGHDR
jgi:hypothetical protein